MALPEVRMSFVDRGALERELDQNFRHGRAFVSQAGDLPVLSECVLVLVHPENGQELRLSAQVVMVNESGPMCGMGIALSNFGSDAFAQVQEFARTLGLAESAPENENAVPPEVETAGGDEAPALVEPPPASPVVAPEAVEVVPDPLSADATQPLQPAISEVASAAEPEAAAETPDEPLPLEAAVAEPVEEQSGDLPPPGDDEMTTADEQELSLEEGFGAESDTQKSAAIDLQAGGSKHEKLRHLSAAEQLKVARTGELSERIAVERLYGKQVWDALLHNPRISVPEVARIARKGTVPKPLLEVIVENGSWIKADAVRRALLSNPKVGSEAVLKLLRLTPKHELKHIDKGTAYGQAVREAARKLLKQLEK